MRTGPLSTAIRSLLSPEVEFDLWSGDEEPGPYAEEEASIKRAVHTRRVEFARGRACARKALVALGAPRQPIPVGPGREPLWPTGFVGSITHCDGLVAAIAACAHQTAAIGIDAEPAVALPRAVSSLVLLPSEVVDDSRSAVLETAVFSAKESIHKALFPLTRIWMDFMDVEVQLNPGEGSFTARRARGVSSPPPCLEALTGRF